MSVTVADNLLVGSKGESLAVLQADASDARRAIVVWTVGAARTPYSAMPVELVVTDQACDLSDLNTGRAPLLLDHDHSTESVIGVIETAWIEAGCGWAIVRFGSGPRARAVMRDVRDGILGNASVGFSIHAAESVAGPDGEEWQRIVSWSPYEISIVAIGRDRAAHMRVGEEDAVRSLLSDRQAMQKAAMRLRRRSAIRAQAWERWSAEAGDVLAARFEIDRHDVGALLSAMVREQIAALTEAADA